jgi:hypothetical protein
VVPFRRFAVTFVITEGMRSDDVRHGITATLKARGQMFGGAQEFMIGRHLG